MSLRHLPLNADDADDSDSSESVSPVRRSGERKRGNLRKTNSEPSVEHSTQIDLEAIRQLLLTLPKFSTANSNTFSNYGSDAEEINTEIEELRDAAKSIQSLQRVLKGNTKAVDIGMTPWKIGSALIGKVAHRRYFRQLMSCVPSEKETNLLGRLEGVPFVKNYIQRVNCSIKALKLLDSLRMDRRMQQNTETVESETPSVSWKPKPYLLAPPPELSIERSPKPEESMMEADIMLWKKRSRASLRRHNSMRTLAARELYDTEKSFVEGLEYLVQAELVDKIFYKIPEILAHHQVLLSSLSNRLEDWHPESAVGDVLLAHFSKQSMVETYIYFVDNFKYAKTAIAQARQKPSFEKYYQRCYRDHRNKLDLDSLLISPIQRVPRYELILNQLLKHTSIEHADHERMMRAQQHIHQLALAINRQQQHNEQAEQRLREIEAIVDGLEDLVSTGRALLRYDMVTMKSREGHRQRCVFMCSDQLIMTSVRRKDHRLGRRPIEQLSSNPDLTTVVLNVTTSNGVETVPIEFASADRRTQWETAFKEAKAALANQPQDGATVSLHSIVAHQSRPGLQFCAATVLPGKRADGFPVVWACTSDKYSGQVVVISIEGESAVESCAGIGNAAVSAIATVPPASRGRKRSLFRAERSVDQLSRDESVLNLDSSESSSSDTEEEGPTTIWIGNEDGEIFVLNSCERVRNRVRERVAALQYPIKAICSTHSQVFVAAGTQNNSTLVSFRNMNECWDMEHPITIALPFATLPNPIVAVARGLCLATAHQLHILDPDTHGIERSSSILPAGETITCLCVTGALLFATAGRSSSIYAIDAFSLAPLNQFSIVSAIQGQLSGREDILREHKLGSLRVTALVAFRSALWIGTSAGFILSTATTAARSQTTPFLNVLEMGHIGPCRVLLPIPVQPSKKSKKMSLSLPSHQNSQMFLLSCGDGLDDSKGNHHDPITDSINHIILWKT
ncbi:unnamed protein product, partial [Mesorhabditis spiculigera]